MLCLSVGGAEVGMVGCIGRQWARGGRIAVLSAKSGKRRGWWYRAGELFVPLWAVIYDTP